LVVYKKTVAIIGLETKNDESSLYFHNSFYLFNKKLNYIEIKHFPLSIQEILNQVRTKKIYGDIGQLSLDERKKYKLP
jgi:hypothetical protein